MEQGTKLPIFKGWESILTQYVLLWMKSLKTRSSISVCNRLTSVPSHENPQDMTTNYSVAPRLGHRTEKGH